MKNIVIYHSNCADGFTAAWVCRQALGAHTCFVPGVYNTNPPDVTGADVYIVDFSYKLSIMQEIVAKAARVIHIDHHASAIKDMMDYNNDKLTKIYSPENTESGAMLTWKYFYPDKEIPQLIKHVDDRDRWKFLLAGTREIQANMFSYDYTFENWDMLIQQNLEQQMSDGAAIERKTLKDIKELMGVVVRRVNIGGYNIPLANVPYQFGSELCGELAKTEPFAAYYYDTPGIRQFGLRSSDPDGIDVSVIAGNYGGGGHKHASGFRLSYELSMKFEI